MKLSQIASKYGLTRYTTKHGKNFWYRDNGSNILFVGHGDTVQDPGAFAVVKGKTETRIYYPTVDDRAGLYVGLCYLPKAHVKVDILLTEDEEDGRSTALWFDPPKKYNWMFMFDRKGVGAVTYQYGNEALHYRLGKYNFSPVSHGTYSCIRDLEHLGVQGINFGTGYYDNHDEFAYIVVDELRHQLRKFLDFYNEYRFVKMPHDVGYDRFAQAVSYHSYEQTRDDQAENSIKPGHRSKLSIVKVPVEELFGNGDIVDADFEVIDSKFEGDPSIDDDSFKVKPSEDVYTTYDMSKQQNFADYGAYRQAQVKRQRKYPDQSMGVVTPEGKIKWVQDRFMRKLYWPIDVLQIDTVVMNILRNTFKIQSLYDLVQKSPFGLVNSGYLTAIDVDGIVQEVRKHGFTMCYNVQGLMNYKQFERQNMNGWKKREKILRTSTAHKKPVPVEKRMQLVAEQKHEEAKAKPTKPHNPHKHILLYPLPSADIPYLFQQMRDLRKGGYEIEVRQKCEQCNKDFEIDINLTDQLPKSCESCQAVPEKVVSSKGSDIVWDESSTAGEEVYTKIQLRKDALDDTQFEYIGKDGGKGVDKYGWVKPETSEGKYRRADGADIYVRERSIK